MSHSSHFLTLYYRPLLLNSTIIHHNSTAFSQQGFHYIFTTIISQKAPRSGHQSSRYNLGQHLSKVLAPINYIPSSSKRTWDGESWEQKSQPRFKRLAFYRYHNFIALLLIINSEPKTLRALYANMGKLLVPAG